MEISAPGPVISEADIVVLENRLGVRFPSRYRDFLLQHNGGQPTPDIIDIADAPGTPTDVQVFFGIERPVESSDISWNVQLLLERCPNLRAIPIGCDSGGNLFCLRIEGESAGMIVYCDLDSSDCDIYHVAHDFDEFLSLIRSFD